MKPKMLYKYRHFDEHTFEMLDNNYLYLCPAFKLDDLSECVTSMNIENYYDISSDTLRRECVEQILQLIKPYTTKDNFESVRYQLYRIMSPNFKITNHFLLDYASELKKMCPELDTAFLINLLANIPKKVYDPEIKPQIESLLLKGFNARKESGICSLAESSEIDGMWLKYADNYSGYCIEYDFTDYEFNRLLFPVVYEDNKETNFVTQIIATFVGQMINGLSNSQINADRSQFLRLF